MFLSDSALRVIAAATGDVWPQHLWRHDTATTEPLGELARLLHKTTVAFNDNTDQLDPLLTRLAEKIDAMQGELLRHGTIRPGHIDLLVTDMLFHLARHHALRQMLLDAYTAWRTHNPPDTASERHLLLRPGDPASGVATLRKTGADTWQVSIDAEAAAAFDIPYAGRIVGEVTVTELGWQPTAHNNPEHRTTGLSYTLPAHPDLATACRALLRWWQLRHSAAWRSRTPAQLTPGELAALTA